MAFQSSENGYFSQRQDLSKTRIEDPSANPLDMGLKDIAVLVRFGGAIGNNVEVWHYATWNDSDENNPTWELAGALRGLETKYYNDNIERACAFPEDIYVGGIKGQAYITKWLPIAGSR